MPDKRHKLVLHIVGTFAFYDLVKIISFIHWSKICYVCFYFRGRVNRS